MQVTDRRQVPEASTLPDRLAFKTAEAASGQLLAIEDAEGIVTAIVSVTGTEDEVADIIVPGAYAETLVKRRPKVCWAHSWEHPIGRVLHIEELMPGDDRLPTKTKDGQPWDPNAGALVATMQFNMRTREGKDAFEAVRFYSETGECEYSIGYQVPPGKSTRDSKGVRHIKSLDLYELSVVLFGAHTMTGTISIKAALEAAIERKAARNTGVVAKDAPRPRSAKDALAAVRAGHVLRSIEVKDVGDGTQDPKPDAKSKWSDGVMVALYPDPAAADAIAKHIAGPDETTEREDLHVTLAFLGKADEVSMNADEVFRRVSEAVESEPTLTGVIGGIGTFPDTGDGAPTWVPVDVPGLNLLREQIVEALGDVVRTDHGFTPHMTIGYDLGVIDPVPEVPVTFSEVRVVYGTATRSVPLAAPTGDSIEEKSMDDLPLSEASRLTAIEHLFQMGPVQIVPEGKAGGADRNRGGAEELRKYWTTGPGGAKIGWNTPGDFTRCTRLLSEHMTPENAKGYCANRHKEMTGVWPGDDKNTGKKDAYDPSLETKEGATPAGKGYPRLPGSMEERQDALSAALTETLRGEPLGDEDHGHREYEWPGVMIDATFEDHVIVSRYKWDGTDERETYDIPYTFAPDGRVELGDLDRVELQVVALGVNGDDVDDVALGDIIPFADDVAQIAHAFKAAHQSSMQTKAGRVLSGANERKLRNAVENLVNVLAAAGVRIAVEEVEDDDTPDSTKPGRSTSDERKPVDPAVDMTTTSPSASTKSAVTNDNGTIVLDAKSIQETLAALTAD